MIELRLDTESFLLLHDVAYIPSLRRNLISVSVLDRHGYSFHFGGGKVDIFSNSVLIGNGVLFGNLYSLSLHHGPLAPTTLGGHKYFITFIDDFSRYGYVELIHENFDSLIVFKAFKAKVEL